MPSLRLRNIRTHVGSKARRYARSRGVWHVGVKTREINPQNLKRRQIERYRIFPEARKRGANDSERCRIFGDEKILRKEGKSEIRLKVEAV
jgi:hypothetical protein